MCICIEFLTLLCVELLPSTPRHVKVEAISEHTLLVSWNFPAQNAHSVSQYEIDVRLVTSLDTPEQLINMDEVPFTSSEVYATNVTSKVPPTQPPFKMQLKVNLKAILKISSMHI
jgi:hypothetical protein